MGKIFTIAKNTFTEAIRQPVFSTIIFIALLLIFLSPSLTMYTMTDDNKLLRELGLSTLFLAGLFVAIFAAAGAVAEEIENKTITTVMTKPVGRPVFIIAKFLGVSAAIILAHFICSIGLLMAIRHGVMETASESIDWTVIWTAATAIGLTLLLTAFFNYIYDWKFSSTAVVLLAFFATISIVFLTFIDKEWKFNPAGNGINLADVYSSILLLFGILVIAALAVAFSARFNTLITLCLCLGIFLLGLISAYIFSRFADQYIWAQVGKVLIPDLQVFWVSDAIYEGNPVPFKYLCIVAGYAVCYSAGILSLAIAAFQRRQVG